MDIAKTDNELRSHSEMYELMKTPKNSGTKLLLNNRENERQDSYPSIFALLCLNNDPELTAALLPYASEDSIKSAILFTATVNAKESFKAEFEID